MTTPRPLPAHFKRVHAWVRLQPWLCRFTLMNRLLLAMAFLPSGLTKAMGNRFTILPIDDPVGFFFEAMYRTGPFWNFIGIAQLAAALLLIVPSTATLGALLFFPIILSICLITWGVGFGTTVYITTAMLLSATYLVLWDADRIWAASFGLLGVRRGPPLLEGMTWLERVGWVLGGSVGFAFFLVTLSLIPSSFINELFFVGLAAAGMVLTGWIVGLSRSGGGAL